MLGLAAGPDLLRLLVLPVFGWAAWRDVVSRRVPNEAWYPVVAVGVAALAWEWVAPPAPDRLYLVRVAFSLGFVAPLSYLFWRVGGFGGADAKALMALSLCLPTYPTFYLPWVALPLRPSALGVFSLTVVTNAVLVALAYPLALGARNAVGGDWHRAMLLGRRVPATALSTAHGRLFETPEGATRRGLDLDALRMYLRWRGTTLDALRADPERHRRAAPTRTYRPGDGAVDDDAGPDGGTASVGVGGASAAGRDGRVGVDGEGRAAGADGLAESTAAVDGDGPDSPAAAVDGDGLDDPWAAERFLAEAGDAYGTTPETLREGLALVSRRDELWVSPGIPFLLPTFVGLCLGLTYGDLLVGFLVAVGAA
jgi:preflagellin peptidase FlaK